MEGSHAMGRWSKWTHAKEPILLARSRESKIVLGRIGQNGRGVIRMGRHPEHGQLQGCRRFSENHASEVFQSRPHVTVTVWIVMSPHGLGGTTVIRHAMADKLTGIVKSIAIHLEVALLALRF